MMRRAEWRYFVRSNIGRLLLSLGETLETIGRYLQQYADRYIELQDDEGSNGADSDYFAWSALYEGGSLHWEDVPTLSQSWMQELKDKGMNDVSPTLKTCSENEESGTTGFVSKYPRDMLFPVRFGKDSEQVIWIKPYGQLRAEDGYMHTKVLPEPEKTDLAILSAMTVMEIAGDAIDITKLRKALNLIEFPLKQRIYDYMITYTYRRNYPVEPEERYEKFALRMKDTTKGQIDACLKGQVRTLAYVVALLRHYRPGFDDFDKSSQIALIERTIKPLERIVVAVREATGAIQEADPWSGRPKRPVTEAPRYVRAAMIADVEGLGTKKIGEKLDLKQTERDVRKNDNRKAANATKSGRIILKDALGEEGYLRLVNDLKSQRKWYFSLSREEQQVEWKSDALRDLVQRGVFTAERVRRMFTADNDYE